MNPTRLAGTSFALAFLVVACAPHSIASAVPAAAQTALKRMSETDKPLAYSLTIENKLSDALSVKITPGKDATLTGPASFELKPGEHETLQLTIPKYEAGIIAGILAQNAVSSQQMLNTLSLAATKQGVALIYSVDTASGLSETTISTINADNAVLTVTAQNPKG